MSKLLKTTMHEITREIIVRAREGDIEAFEQIYRASAGFVYTLALRVSRNRQDAEEITQDVFLKIHRYLGSFAFRSSFKTWVYRIAVNTALNAEKRIRRELGRRADFDTVIETHGQESVVPESGSAEDTSRKLRAYLGLLNPSQRAVLVMREIEGASYRQIAEALRTNINTVRSRLRRARQTLMGENEHREDRL